MINVTPVSIHRYSISVCFWCVCFKGFFSDKHLACCCVLSDDTHFGTLVCACAHSRHSLNACIIQPVHRRPVLGAGHFLNSKEKSRHLAQCGEGSPLSLPRILLSKCENGHIKKLSFLWWKCKEETTDIGEINCFATYCIWFIINMFFLKRHCLSYSFVK